MSAMYDQRWDETLVVAEPLEVECPECEAAPNQPCQVYRWGYWLTLSDFHPDREDRAANTELCPACGEPDTEVAGDDQVAYDRCPTCGWRGDPR